MEYSIISRIVELERRIGELEEVMKGIENNIDRINPSNTKVKTIKKKEDKEEEESI